MGQYKVPQNVEAEDKILGPFSFRQFIYLIVAGVCGVIMWFIVQGGVWPFVFIPLPVFLLCLALALPLRKDQPMETYLLAIVKYILLPKKRLWRAGSFMPNVDVDAITISENPVLKDIRGSDATNRISFLAQVVDTAGWSTRGTVMDRPSENMNEQAAQEAIRQANSSDQFDETNLTAQIIDSKLSSENPIDSAIINKNRSV
jgi:hypothetical protein